jgi:hypothetical protein
MQVILNKYEQKYFFLSVKKGVGSGSISQRCKSGYPDPLARGANPGIRIRTKMSRIPNTDRKILLGSLLQCLKSLLSFCSTMFKILLSSLLQCLKSFQFSSITFKKPPQFSHSLLVWKITQNDERWGIIGKVARNVLKKLNYIIISQSFEVLLTSV